MILGLKAKALWIAGVLLAISVAANAAQMKKVIGLHEELALAEVSIASQQGVISVLRDKMSNSQAALQNQAGAIRALEAEFQRKDAQLESYKKRRNVALAKPKMVEKLANRATKKVFQSIVDATGGSK